MKVTHCQRSHGDNICCTCTYCPIIIAWATTAHKFQGFQAGPKPTDAVRYILANFGTTDYEKSNPGTAYVILSRARSIGTKYSDKGLPLNSDIYFIGTLGEERFQNLKLKNNGEMCIKVERRERWVDHLKKQSKSTNDRLQQNDTLKRTKKTVTKELNNSIFRNKRNLARDIMNILLTPNDTWVQNRKKTFKY